MLFNFYIWSENGRTISGVCTADTKEDAEAYVLVKRPLSPGENINVEPGLEDFLNEEYGGFAYLTTEST